MYGNSVDVDCLEPDDEYPHLSTNPLTSSLLSITVDDELKHHSVFHVLFDDTYLRENVEKKITEGNCFFNVKIDGPTV